MQSNWWKIAIVVGIIVVAGAIMVNKSDKGNRIGNPSVTATMPLENDLTVEAEDAKPKESAKSEQKLPDVMTHKKSTQDTRIQDKRPGKDSSSVSKTTAKISSAVQTKPGSQAKTEKRLPRLVDLGATKCVPCKMMAPVLEELRTEYKGQLIVEFIDVWENSSAGEKYGINSIPTQIFFDETGKEVFRHVGFFPKEDILSTFKAHGINLEKGK
ncbi:MAG: thioredoxin family protein [bacterium]|jgi:thioredoxin 1|nr:thioredoxin family protein [bacterium]